MTTDFEKFVEVPKGKGKVWIQLALGVFVSKDGRHMKLPVEERLELPLVEAQERNARGEFAYHGETPAAGKE